MEDDRKREQSQQDPGKKGEQQPGQGSQPGQGQKQPWSGQEQKRPQTEQDEKDKERKSA